jgi:uncharacterized membrane protein YhaH (DUF805 family)
MKTFIFKLYSCKGRITRSEFIPTFLSLTFLSNFMIYLTMSTFPVAPPLSVRVFLIIGLFVFGYPIICTTIKRCHDLNWSWIYALTLFIRLANLVVILTLMLKTGEYSSNKYGESPYVKNG